MEAPKNENFRDSIGTITKEGKRAWVFPKKPNGRFYNYRKYVSYFLLLFLFSAPFIKVNGNQFLLFNVIERRFNIFGFPFWPQDFHLFVISMIIGVVFITLFTDIIFCTNKYRCQKLGNRTANTITHHFSSRSIQRSNLSSLYFRPKRCFVILWVVVRQGAYLCRQILRFKVFRWQTKVCRETAMPVKFLNAACSRRPDTLPFASLIMCTTAS